MVLDDDNSVSAVDSLCLVPDTRGRFDLRRQAILDQGAPIDATGAVVRIESAERFDVRKSVEANGGFSAVGMYVKQLEMSYDKYWDAATARSIAEGFARRPKLALDAPLVRFMEEECNFDISHLDGSFMSHNTFCAHFGALHMPQFSSRVLFAHSILGTKSNVFPMALTKLPKLRALLSEWEMRQVEAFPSLLRALDRIYLELWDNRRRLWDRQLAGIRLHRLIDNAPITLSADELWVGLNYQLIHLIDFSPTTCWLDGADPAGSVWMKSFSMTRGFLRMMGRLYANVSAFADLSPRHAPPERKRCPTDDGLKSEAWSNTDAMFDRWARMAAANATAEAATTNGTTAYGFAFNNSFELLFLSDSESL